VALPGAEVVALVVLAVLVVLVAAAAMVHTAEALVVLEVAIEGLSGVEPVGMLPIDHTLSAA
jgi:hypothetical protein